MHHNYLFDSGKTACRGRKNLYSKVNTKMLLAGQIPGFLNFTISEVKSWVFLHACVYQLKLQIDDVIQGSCCQA